MVHHELIWRGLFHASGTPARSFDFLSRQRITVFSLYSPSGLKFARFALITRSYPLVLVMSAVGVG